jgi:putative transposase
VLKCLAIVDDATTEALAIVPARALGGLAVTPAVDGLAATRALPGVLRTDSGPEVCGKAMLTWAYERRVTLSLIETGKPTQNAYIESFNGTVPRRVSERTLVHQPHPRGSDQRIVAPRVQRGAPEEGPRRADARRLRKAANQGRE